MEQPSRLTFRISIWRPWLLVVIPLALLAAFGVIISLVSGKPAAVVGILLGFAGVAGVLLLPIGLAVWVSRFGPASVSCAHVRAARHKLLGPAGRFWASAPTGADSPPEAIVRSSDREGDTVRGGARRRWCRNRSLRLHQGRPVGPALPVRHCRGRRRRWKHKRFL
jgi:hypothetical protein